MNTKAKVILWEARKTLTRSIALTPPNLIVARLALTNEPYQVIIFCIAIVLTQVAAAKLALILTRKCQDVSMINHLIVLISALTTTWLAIRYLGAKNQQQLYFSAIATQCLALAINGIWMTLLSIVRFPALQAQVAKLEYRGWLNTDGQGDVYYLTAVGLGALIATAFYLGTGYLLSKYYATSYQFLNQMVGIALLVVTATRLGAWALSPVTHVSDSGQSNAQILKLK